MGRDIPTRPRPCAPGHFNPRAPYGARPAAGAEKQSSLNFNPLARVGRDGTSSSRCKDRRLSIHARVNQLSATKKQPLQQSVITLLQGLLRLPYALIVGVSDLSSTVLISHTAPCITLGSTMASRQ